MKSSVIVWIFVVILLLIGAWYFLAPKSAAAPAPSEGAPTATNSSGAYVAGNLLLGTDANAALGTYLIGSSGMPLYMFDRDTMSASNCTDQCATNWPPYTITDPTVLANVQAGISGTAGEITRPDGTMQVTYKGKPVYFYSKDTASSGPTGDGVNGTWHIAKP